MENIYTLLLCAVDFFHSFLSTFTSSVSRASAHQCGAGQVSKQLCGVELGAKGTKTSLQFAPKRPPRRQRLELQKHQ